MDDGLNGGIGHESVGRLLAGTASSQPRQEAALHPRRPGARFRL